MTDVVRIDVPRSNMRAIIVLALPPGVHRFDPPIPMDCTI
jgi:hypothetical protein